MSRPEHGFSVLALGRQLDAMREREHQLDLLCLRLGVPQTPALADQQHLAQRHAKSAREAISAHCDALEELILATRAETLGDALVQAMVTHARINLVANCDAKADREREQGKVEAALQGMVRVLGREAGVPLVGVGGRYYAPTWADPWPDVDVSGVRSDIAEAADFCIDGSGAGSCPDTAGKAAA